VQHSIAPATSRRHPGWGIVAQLVGAAGVVVLVLLIAGTWVGYGFTSDAVGRAVGDLDSAATSAVQQAEEVAVALEQQAEDPTTDAETAELLRQGAQLTRQASGQVVDIQGQVGNLEDTARSVLLAAAGMGTGFLVYLVLIHAGVFTLGRHWRRD
jgi:hypothetical protein